MINCKQCLVISFLLCIVSSHPNDLNNKQFVYENPKNCNINQYYNLDYFQCSLCMTEKMWQPSTDGFNCDCLSNTVVHTIYDTYQNGPICLEPCIQKNQTDNCIDVATNYNARKCHLIFINYANTRKINKSVDKAIQIFEKFDFDNTSTTETNCSCNINNNFHYKDYCIGSSMLRGFLSYNSFWQWGSFIDLKFVVFFCRTLRNSTACNHLANLCVLSFYNSEKNSPCSLFLLAQTSDMAIYSGVEGLKDFRPFLFYRKGKLTEEEIMRSLDFSYRLGESYENSKLDFFTTIYNLDGRLERWGALLPHHLNLCYQSLVSNYAYFQFGKNFKSQCQLSLENIINLASHDANKHFLNIFLNSSINGKHLLQPIPILIENLYSNNYESKPIDWQLVKRFQMIAAEKRFRKFETNFKTFDDTHKLQQYKTIRYVNKFKIHCTIRNNNKIQTPLIILNYKTIEIFENSSLNSRYDFTFEITFTKTQNLEFWFEIVLPILLAIGFIFALLRTYNIKNHQHRDTYDTQSLINFTLHLFSKSANAFLLIAILIIAYVFMIVTYQRTIQILLPINHQDLIEVLIYVAVILKSIYLCYHFWKIANIDLFFIDWERTRVIDGHFNMKINIDTPSVCSSARSLISENNVSAWRIFFVANEWMELSLKRRTSIMVQCLFVIILLNLVENINEHVSTDRMMKLFTIILIYIIIYVFQFFLNKIITQQIYGNPLQQFIDICSIANISVFLLLEYSYGFYIHGRSPHGFSDTDMASMILQLQRESMNMCGKRGLLTDSDQQNYVILAPTDLKVYYQKLLTPLQNAANISQVHFEKEHFINGGKHTDGPLEKTTIAYNNINRFFCAFIDHGIKDMDYIIKERTFLENFLDCEFDNYLSENKGTFYIDNNYSFKKSLLYGNEIQLIILEILILATTFLISNSLLFATLIVCILNLIFRKVFHLLIKNNISSKTLIDKRFLF